MRLKINNEEGRLVGEMVITDNEDDFKISNPIDLTLMNISGVIRAGTYERAEVKTNNNGLVSIGEDDSYKPILPVMANLPYIVNYLKANSLFVE